MGEESNEAVTEAPAAVATEETKPKAEVKSGAKYAGFWIRFVALIIDGVILAIIGKLIGTTGSTILGWVYYVVMTQMYGATLGKMALKLKVVKEDGSPLDWGTVILREVVGKLVSAIILMIGYLMAGFDSKKQALHDKIAKTYVVYK